VEAGSSLLPVSFLLAAALASSLAFPRFPHLLHFGQRPTRRPLLFAVKSGIGSPHFGHFGTSTPHPQKMFGRVSAQAETRVSRLRTVYRCP
jgi:hypothetical protein